MKKVAVLFCLIFVFPVTALAVPPPDFVFAIGSSIVQALSVVALFLSAMFYAMRDYIRVFWAKLSRVQKFLIKALVLILVLVLVCGVYFFSTYKKQAKYQEWLVESEQEQEIYEDKEQEEIDTKRDFIFEYYKNISDGNFVEAYEVSTKSVSLEIFEDWYKDLDRIDVSQVDKISEDRYFVRLAYYDLFDVVTYYEVTMTLDIFDPDNISIKESEVDQVEGFGSEPVRVNTPESVGQTDDEGIGYVSNFQFSQIIRNEDVFVLDAREDEEYAIGQYPGSTHIRFADLLDGGWSSLPNDSTIYVLCWSGIRGSEVASFLNNKGLDAKYLEDGANGWVAYGGLWNGEIKFNSTYKGDQYSRLLSYDELVREIAAGTVIVDARQSQKYNAWHIPGSVSMSIIYTPSDEMDALLDQVPRGSRVVSVCDDFVNCFDSKIGALKLEQRGITFLGRYNKPWEYRSNM